MKFKNLIYLGFVTMLIFSVSGVADATTISVSRDLPMQVAQDNTFKVTLDVVVGVNPPNGVIIRDYVPSGWTVVASNPPIVKSSKPGEVKWTLAKYGNTLYSRQLTYMVQVPYDAMGTATFHGDYLYMNASGYVNPPIEGDTQVTVISGAPRAVTVNRTLPSLVIPPKEFSVILTIDVNESNAPNEVTIKDYFPVGWNITDSSPVADNIDPSTGEIKWVLSGNAVVDQIISYSIQGVSIDDLFDDHTFYGEVLYLLDEVNISDEVSGDRIINRVITDIITVDRTLPSIVNFGPTFTVLLDINISTDDSLKGITITDYVPVGWTVISSNPTMSSFNSTTGEIKWSFYGGDLVSQKIRYTLRVSTPHNRTGDTCMFGGYIRYIANSTEIIRSIGGDDKLCVCYRSLGIVTINRTLPTAIYAGGNFTVTLTVDIDETQKPIGVIIDEYLPPGWNIVSSNPSMDMFDFENGEAKWLFYLGGVADQTINYTVSVPTTDSEGMKSFSGIAIYKDHDQGGTGIDITVGDTEIEVVRIPGDTNGDGKLSDSELLTLISQWAQGEVNDLDLLTAIKHRYSKPEK